MALHWEGTVASNNIPRLQKKYCKSYFYSNYFCEWHKIFEKAIVGKVAEC